MLTREKIMKYIKKYVLDSSYRFLVNASFGLYNSWEDEKYIKYKFFAKMGRELNLETPETFNEKLQWLKLYDRKPEYTTMVDKYGVKKYIADKIGEEYIIPTLGVWERFEDIDFDALPNQFVLKCTHDSGGLVICKDKNKLDVSAARKKIAKSLKTNYYYSGREWPYKNVKPRIIAEQYMADDAVFELRDYKIHCFNGEPKMTLVCSDRFSESGLREDFFDENWCHIPVKRPDHPNSEISIDKPVNFEQMKELARNLSKDIPFVRTDFYEINGNVYFGELTFYPASGFSKFDPEQWAHKLGEWIKLPEKSGGGYFTLSDDIVLIFRETNQSKNDNLTDYKFFCFNGNVDCVMVCLDRSSGDTKFYFFDRAWNLLRYNIRGKNAPENFTIPKPSNMDEMFDIAEKLSKGLPFARIDLYSVSGRTYFGEITFFPDSGFDKNLLPETDLHWGKKIDISRINSEVNGNV